MVVGVVVVDLGDVVVVVAVLGVLVVLVAVVVVVVRVDLSIFATTTDCDKRRFRLRCNPWDEDIEPGKEAYAADMSYPYALHCF